MSVALAIVAALVLCMIGGGFLNMIEARKGRRSK